MPIIIPSIIQNLPVPAFVVDTPTGSSGSTSTIANVALACYLYQDNGPNCGSVIGNGASGSWSINDLNDCSKRSRYSLSSKYIDGEASTGVPAGAGVDGGDISAFTAEWLALAAAFRTFLDGSPAAGTAFAPSGYTQKGQTYVKTVAGATDGSIIYTATSNPLLSNAICVTTDPNNPSCTLDAILKASISLTAVKRLSAPFCTSVSFGSAGEKHVMVQSLFESGDATLVGNSLPTNVYV